MVERFADWMYRDDQHKHVVEEFILQLIFHKNKQTTFTLEEWKQFFASCGVKIDKWNLRERSGQWQQARQIACVTDSNPVVEVTLQQAQSNIRVQPWKWNSASDSYRKARAYDALYYVFLLETTYNEQQ